MKMNQGVLGLVVALMGSCPSAVQAKPKVDKNCAECRTAAEQGIYPQAVASDVKTIEDHSAQVATKYSTSTGTVGIHLESLVSDIDAKNKTAVCEIDIASGSLRAQVNMAKFAFDNSLMKEHFEDEDFLDVGRYPSATFTGTVPNFATIAASPNGSSFNVEVTGPLTIHGVTKEVKFPVSLKHLNGKLVGTAKTKFKINEYGISIPFPKNAILPNDTEVELDIKFDLEKK